MIKTLVYVEPHAECWEIYDADKVYLCATDTQIKANQIVSALNAEPKCETCGGSRRRPLCIAGSGIQSIPCPACAEPSGELVKDKTCETCEHSMYCTHERKRTHNKNGECSRHCPAPNKGRDEIIEDMPSDDEIGDTLIIYADTNELVPKPILRQAAARIQELEKACGLAYEGLCTNDTDACDNAILFIDKIMPSEAKNDPRS